MAWATPTRLKQFATDATDQSSLVSGTAITGAAAGTVAFIELGYGLGSSPTYTVTDSVGHTYSLLTRADKLTSNVPHSAIFWVVLTAAIVSGSTTASIVPSANFNFPCALWYYSTPPASTTISAGTTAAGGTGVSGTPSSGNFTTTVADALLLMANCTGPVQTLTAGTSWTLLDSTSPTSSKQLDGEWRSPNATGTYTGDGTHTSADWACCAGSLYATAAGGGAVTPTRGLLGVGS